MFKFLDYTFDPQTFVAKFSYQGADSIIFTEQITFAKPESATTYNSTLLDRALFLALYLLALVITKHIPQQASSSPSPLTNFKPVFLIPFIKKASANLLSKINLRAATLLILLLHLIITLQSLCPMTAKVCSLFNLVAKIVY